MRNCLLILLFLAATPLAAGELYRWIDDDGTVHFSDRKPADDAESVDLEPLNLADPVDTDRATQAGTTVTMYSTSWCGYCKKARRYFTAEGIPFREHDIEKSRRARRAYERLGGGGVPLIKVGERTMNGFSVDGFERFYRP
ncbi:MAG: DUF4124 domain-containing protein [Halofilum sp. (in: g-proteobacteria)]|nr:DUF4124 domain-containing protein [Halofilum sp. (in: g-proteobacteria)]